LSNYKCVNGAYFSICNKIVIPTHVMTYLRRRLFTDIRMVSAKFRNRDR
jgi:hypothetical protein